MKTSYLLPACLAATLFLFPVLRAADSAAVPAAPVDGPAPTTQDSAARQAELLKRYDKNGDGKLDDSERAGAKAEMHQNSGRKEKMHERALELYDKNGDGKLDETERAAAMADILTRPRILKRFDKDGDGKLNSEEQAAAEKAIRQRLAEHNKSSASTSSAVK